MSDLGQSTVVSDAHGRAVQITAVLMALEEMLVAQTGSQSVRAELCSVALGLCLEVEKSLDQIISP